MKKVFVTILIALQAIIGNADSFSDAVDRLLRANAEYKAAEARTEADNAALRTENALPDPEISVETLFGTHDNKYNFGVSQGFDWPGLYKARSEAARLGADVNSAALDVKVAENRARVTELLLDIIASHKKITDYTATLGMLNDMLDTYRKMLDSGDATIVSVNKLSIEVADFEQLLDDQQQALADAIAELSAMTFEFDVEGLVADITEFPIYCLRDKAAYHDALVDNSPELQLIQKQIDLDNANRKVAAMSGNPGFSLGYRYSNEDAQSYNGFTLGVTLPVWSARSKKAAAGKAVDASRFEYIAAVTSLTNRIDSDYATAVSLKARIDKYSKALAATDNIGILQRAFDARQITLTDYIQDIRYFTEAQMRLYDLQRDYAATLAALERYIR